LRWSTLAAGLALAGCGSSKGSNTPADAGAQMCGVPASFAWSSSDPILTPVSDAKHDLVAIKDPSVVFFNGSWHVFVSTVSTAGSYSLAYINFPDWDHVADATVAYLDQTPGLTGYHAAPQVFYFAPQQKWYLIYQSGPPTYSVSDDPGNPLGWSPPAQFYPGGTPPPTVTQNMGSGGWLDFWVICDGTSCYLFFSDDNGHWYRSQTAESDFPHNFGDATVVLQDATPSRLFEASNVYKMKGTGKYLALVEGYDASSSYHRYFRSWTADALDGDWTPLQDSYAAPFASYANVTFATQPAWTQDISHGEMLRDGYDENLEIDTCHLQYLYQGVDPSTAATLGGAQYNMFPWKLALLTSSN
jgi:hypothetical protein